MKQISIKIATLTLIAILFVSNSPYLLAIFVSAHGSHKFDASFDGDSLKVTLLHSEESHTHDDAGNHDTDNHHHDSTSHNETRNHEVMGSFEQAKTSSEVQIATPALITVMLSSIFPTSYFSDLKLTGTFKIMKVQRPPSALTLQRTIVLHI